MDDALLELKLCNLELNPGATSDELGTLEAALDYALPSELAHLYATYNGAMERGTMPFRLMPIDEVIRKQESFRNLEYNKFGARFFWTDDNSNYAGMYLTGPLTGYICFLDHEDADLSPVYPSLLSFIRHQLAAASTNLAWYEMPTIYPRLNPAENSEEAAKDWEIVQLLSNLLARTEVVGDREQYAFTIMALVPIAHSDVVLSFLKDKDGYIQQRACLLIGLRKYEAAVLELAIVARSGQHKANMAAVLALGNIHSQASQEQLESLRQQLPTSYHHYLDAALRKHGGDIIQEGRNLRFQLPRLL